ncbi:DUF1150 family protein [Indioceanicola profundi]|uniref:DUF1150 family protein n=1 Tax=Indioceanicola profundi TaxID=2220096 RepID=UPI000E6AA4E4|nr:DUF1150 family protein [Indioceanicola profundi]
MNPTTLFLRQLSPQDFAAFGLNDVAYVKRIERDGAAGFAIHAADGTPLTVVPNEQLALATVRQNDMEALSVH